MKNVMKTLLSALVLVALLASCKSEANGPLLKGTAKFLSPTEFAINYLPDGNLALADVRFFEPDSVTGAFEFDAELQDDFGDYEILVGNALYGVHLEKGTTTEMNIVETTPGQYAITFSGDNAALSEVMSVAFPAYDLFTYSSQSDDSSSEDEFLSRLEKAHKGAMAKLDLIQDAKQKEWYTERLENMYMGTKARILEDKAGATGTDVNEMPEYRAIIDKIDPNSDIAYFTYNSMLWIGAQLKNKADKNMLPVSLETMDLVDARITNPRVKKMEAYFVGQSFFAYGDHETGKEEFWTRYKAFAKDYPEFIKAFEAEYNKVVTCAEGIEMPELTLTKPDGSTVSITSLYGKYTYVDVWATWCGPCCKEIPHLEKLVARMADQDKVQFVSFSVDEDLDAWKNKLNADKPEWPQYVLASEANKALSEALNITGIPRFFIIDPDGKILNPNAKRPSDESLEAELRAL